MRESIPVIMDSFLNTFKDFRCPSSPHANALGKHISNRKISICVVECAWLTTLCSGALPRQLALECLDSIQKVLFPFSDHKSRSLLESLISTSSFDADCLEWDFYAIRNADEKDVTYHYLGTRLADLYQELEDPTPRGWIERWFERKKGGRYVMMATLIGVVIAVVLGMTGLALGAYQAWLTYQQWQHPVKSG